MNYNRLQKAKQIALRRCKRLKHYYAEEATDRDIHTIRKWLGRKIYDNKEAELEDRIPIMHTNGSSFYEDHAIRKMAISKKNNTWRLYQCQMKPKYFLPLF